MAVGNLLQLRQCACLLASWLLSPGRHRVTAHAALEVSITALYQQISRALKYNRAILPGNAALSTETRALYIRIPW